MASVQAVISSRAISLQAASEYHGVSRIGGNTLSNVGSTTVTARSTYLWNTASGLLMAFQSVIMLVVLTRTCDVTTSGIFTLAYANASLFLNLGKYGVRNFQVSDVNEEYDFKEYFVARLISVSVMIVLGSACLAFSARTVGYSIEKSLTLFMMLMFKAVDAMEDVFHGNYQQHGRLDVGAKMLTLRMVTMIALYACLIFITRNLLLALTATTIFTGSFFVTETLWVRRHFGLPVTERTHSCDSRKVLAQVGKLLHESFPVFLATFLLFYIGNAPKYAIDAVMDDAAQAHYGFIAMPVFVVGLLANFIYNPIIASLAESWYHGERAAFARRFALQVLIIVGITVTCVVTAWLIGVPVLNLLYNTELEHYKLDLAILMVGGGLLAVATLFTTGITIIRCQGKLTVGYIVVASIAAVVSPHAVSTAGIDGASWIYLLLMALLSLWFGGVFVFGIKQAN